MCMGVGGDNNKKRTSSRFAIVNIIISAIFFISVAIFLLVAERPLYSETERRALARMPEFGADAYFSGEYANGLSEFYNDAVPNRDYFKAVAAKFRGFFGISFNDAEFYFEDPIFTTVPETEALAETTKPQETTATAAAEETTDVVSAITTETTPPPEETTAEEEVNLEITNNIFVLYVNGHWRAMPRFGGGSPTVYTNSLAEYKKDLPDVEFYSMIIPTQEEFYLPAKYADYAASHKDVIDTISGTLSGVTPVDAYSALKAHTNEEIFARTDHHWLPLGAFYAAEEFAKTAGVPFSSLDAYTRVDVEGYLGSLYGQTESPKLLDDPEVFTYYKPANEYTTHYYTIEYVYEYTLPFFVPMPAPQSYSTFMGGDSKIVRVETDVKNGRKLAIWKDSYGNALVPFLMGSFEEIIVLDVRYFKLNAIDFMKEMGVTDVLFSVCTFTAVDKTKSAYFEENRLRE